MINVKSAIVHLVRTIVTPMRSLVLIAISSLMLSGCLTVNETLATAATAGTALVTTSVGLPPVVALTTSAAAGLTTGALTEEPKPEVNLSEVTNEYQAEVVKHEMLWHTIELFWQWVVGAVVFLIIVAWLIPGPQSLFFWRRKD